MPVTKLAKRLNLARTTVQARLDRLEHSKVIQGYAVRLNENMRAPIRATVLLAIEPRSAPTVLARLETHLNVMAVYTTSGRFDMIVELEAQSTEELDTTLDQIGEAKGVKSSESLIHLSTRINRRR